MSFRRITVRSVPPHRSMSPGSSVCGDRCGGSAPQAYSHFRWYRNDRISVGDRSGRRGLPGVLARLNAHAVITFLAPNRLFFRYTGKFNEQLGYLHLVQKSDCGQGQTEEP